ncbi:hypothetical protein FDA94_15755 [Herbidospora galbida]|uniref:EI24 domain-containing protein n=1 Tax=Herbidospora galbida TaxID=2575442 RepID=A0A4U3MGT0_9ACTN|nr:EI24 domain-containing protein [Herbidospora galbida]TKK88010.1 hypothetical protein FDA94_15755 [Herbidospora galbida]
MVGGGPVRRQAGGFFDGVGCYLRGIGWMARHPRWWLFGLIPALIAFAVFAGLLVLLAVNAADVAAWMTPFADDWGWREFFRTLVGVLLVIVGALLSIVLFTAVSLAIGEPFYEKISEQVEESLGGPVHHDDTPLVLSILRSIKDSLVTLCYVLLFTIPLFVLGFVPFVGQTVVPVIGALVSGYFLTVELTALAMERRGVRRKYRFAVLKANRGMSLGFGVAVFVTFLVPFLAIAAMPCAVAGAAIMVRDRMLVQGPGQPAFQPPPRRL